MSWKNEIRDITYYHHSMLTNNTEISQMHCLLQIMQLYEYITLQTLNTVHLHKKVITNVFSALR